MLLVDSTVWVDYFNGTLTPETEYLDGAVTRELVLVGDIILAEVLQGFRDDSDYRRGSCGAKQISSSSDVEPGVGSSERSILSAPAQARDHDTQDN